MPLMLLLVFVLCIAVASLYGVALGAYSRLGRYLEERDGSGNRAGLPGFILRDAHGALCAWAIGGSLLGLTSVLVLHHGLAALLPAGPRFLAGCTVGVDLLAGLAGLRLWKMWASTQPHTYCLVAAAFVVPFYLIVYPLRGVLGAVLEELYPPLALRAGLLLSADVEDIAADREHGQLLDHDGREMIQRVFSLRDTLVREIMVPRIDVVAVEESSAIAAFVRLSREKRHSRLPVYRGSIDNIVGFLHIKDLIAEAWDPEHERQLEVAALVRPAYFVPETKRADELLAEMRARRTHLAIVVDEYGGTAGIVTLEDVIEEVVGEIQDESDKEQPLISRLADGSFRVDAKVDLDDLNDRLEAQLPAEEYDTLGGFLYALAGKIPAPGNRFQYEGFEFVVAGVRGKRITHVIVRPPASQTVEEKPLA